MQITQRMAAVLVGAALAFSGCSKLGTSGSTSSASTNSATTRPAQPAAPHPTIRITSPARASFLAPGLVAVEGHVESAADGVPVTSAQLAGQPVQLDGSGNFRSTLTLVQGLNTLEAQCLDAQGRQGATTVGVLAGSYKPLGERISQAAVGRITNPALDATAKIVEQVLWSEDWTAILKGISPITATNFLWMRVLVNFDQVRFRDVHAALQAKPGAAGVTIQVMNPVIDVTVMVDLGFTTIGPFPAQARADLAQLDSDVAIAVQPDGSLLANASNPNVSFTNFALDVQSTVLDAAVQLFAMNTIKNKLADYVVDAVANKLPPLIDQQIVDYFQPKVPWQIFGKPLQVDVRGEQLAFDAGGLTFDFSFNAMTGTPTARSLLAPGSLVTTGAGPAVMPNRGFFACADDDGFNRILHVMWAGGLWDLDIDAAFLAAENVTMPVALEAATLKRFLPEIGPNVPDSAPLKIHFEPGLPAVVKVTGTPDLVRIQAGEVAMDIFCDRGNGWEKLLRVVLQVDMGANCGLSAPGLQISAISNPSFKFDVVESPIVAFDERRLEVTLSVLLTPLVPHFLNTLSVIGIPHLSILTTFNVDEYADGAAREHLSIAGDMTR